MDTKKEVRHLKVVHSGLGVHVVGWMSRSPVSPLKQIPENHSPLFGGGEEHMQKLEENGPNII